MNHEEVQTRHLVELYVTRKLNGEDSARFEEHFVDCVECLDQIERAERFQQALAKVSIRAQWWKWAAAAAILTAVCGAALWNTVRQQDQLQVELRQTQKIADEWKQRYEREAKASRETPLERPMVASTFTLNTTRSAGTAESVPPNRISLAAADPQWIVLSLDRDWEPAPSTIRISLVDSAAKLVWQKEGLSGTPRTAVSVGVPSGLLPPGDYSLLLESKGADGNGYSSSGRYRFRVTRE